MKGPAMARYTAEDWSDEDYVTEKRKRPDQRLGALSIVLGAVALTALIIPGIPLQALFSLGAVIVGIVAAASSASPSQRTAGYVGITLGAAALLIALATGHPLIGQL